MILVDTSILISFFKGNITEQVKKFEAILQHDIPFGINNLIYQELLQGAKTDKEFKLLDDYLVTQTFYNLKDEISSYKAAALIYYNCRKNGFTIRSTVDLLIAQTAIDNDLYLLHDDKDFSNIASCEKNLKEY